MNILAPGNVLIQEFEEIIALFLLEPNDISCELGIYEQSLFSGRRVSPHKGMD